MYTVTVKNYQGIEYVDILKASDQGFVISIPTDPANTDYAQFKLDLSEGAELQNADGVAMTQAEVDAFLEELP